ncbi:MAG: hypothetical protein ACI4NP_03965 [Thermoguttaceae bacterium]
MNTTWISRRVLCAFLLFSFVSTLVGCWQPRQIKVSGRVAFPDGTPLTCGQVCFFDGYYLGRGDLDENGEYELRIFRKNDGVPPGVYQAYITSAIRFEGDDSRTNRRNQGLAKLVTLIDRQYMMDRTSGWICEVDKKHKRFDFTVYPPGEVPEDQITDEARFQFDEEYRQEKVKEYWREKSEEEREEAEKSGRLPEELASPQNHKTRRLNPSLL